MGWETLADIKAQAVADSRKPDVKVPVSCPIDGELLDVNSKGQRECPMGNYRWP